MIIITFWNGYYHGHEFTKISLFCENGRIRKFHKSSNTPVTLEEKQIRANEIAQNLSDNKEWKSHGRPISREELGKLKLKIDNLEDIPEAYKAISEYNELMRDYIGKYSMKQFIQTRRFL